jgi:hypothetical protein
MAPTASAAPEPTSTTASSFWETPRTDHAIRATASAARTETPLLLAAERYDKGAPRSRHRVAWTDLPAWRPAFGRAYAISDAR